MTSECGLKNPKTKKFGNPIFWVFQYKAPSHNAESDRNRNLKKTKSKF